MNKMIIKNREVGPGEPCYVIAEAGINHNGSLDMALELVDVAVAAGVDAVKFQMRDLQSLYPEELLNNPNLAEWAFQYLLPQLKSTQLTLEEFKKIKVYCDKNGITFMCTPFDAASFKSLEEIGVSAYKVASADLVNIPLLDLLVSSGKPLILSTGMATEHEIRFTVERLQRQAASFALLHCVSTYPAPFENLNLPYISELQKYDVPVGYSGHERGVAMPLVALAFGACIIEKHVTLDRTMVGPDHASSLEPGGLKRLVRDIRNAEKALIPHRKNMSTMEKLNQQVFRKSLVARRNCCVGEEICSNMIAVKGPGKGLSPQRYDDLLGKVLTRGIEKGDVFIESDIVAPSITGNNENNVEFIHKWGLKARFHDYLDVIKHGPQLIELHFSSDDLGYDVDQISQTFPQQLVIHAPEFDQGKLLDICSMDEIQRKHTVNLFQKTIDKAAELGNRFSGPVGVVFHLGGMSLDTPVEERKTLLEMAAEEFEKLDDRGCVLLPENLPPRPWYLGGQWYQNLFAYAEDFEWFCQETGVGMTLDLAHAQMHCNYRNEKLDEYVSKCLPYIHHVHISDAKGIDGEGLQIGEGDIKWKAVLGVLSKAKFTWVPEVWSGHLNDNKEALRAIQRLADFEIL